MRAGNRPSNLTIPSSTTLPNYPIISPGCPTASHADPFSTHHPSSLTQTLKSGRRTAIPNIASGSPSSFPVHEKGICRIWPGTYIAYAVDVGITGEEQLLSEHEQIGSPRRNYYVGLVTSFTVYHAEVKGEDRRVEQITVVPVSSSPFPLADASRDYDLPIYPSNTSDIRRPPLRTDGLFPKQHMTQWLGLELEFTVKEIVDESSELNFTLTEDEMQRFEREHEEVVEVVERCIAFSEYAGDDDDLDNAAHEALGCMRKLKSVSTCALPVKVWLDIRKVNWSSSPLDLAEELEVTELPGSD